MSDAIYYCKHEENDCPVKDTCERYVDAEQHQCKVTLYKAMCVDDNYCWENSKREKQNCE